MVQLYQKEGSTFHPEKNNAYIFFRDITGISCTLFIFKFTISNIFFFLEWESGFHVQGCFERLSCYGYRRINYSIKILYNKLF